MWSWKSAFGPSSAISAALVTMLALRTRRIAPSSMFQVPPVSVVPESPARSPSSRSVPPVTQTVPSLVNSTPLPPRVAVAVPVLRIVAPARLVILGVVPPSYQRALSSPEIVKVPALSRRPPPARPCRTMSPSDQVSSPSLTRCRSRIFAFAPEIEPVAAAATVNTPAPARVPCVQVKTLSTVKLPAPVKVLPLVPRSNVPIVDSSVISSVPPARSSPPSLAIADTVVVIQDECTTVIPAGMHTTSLGPGSPSGLQLAASCQEVVSAPPSQLTVHSPVEPPRERITSPAS